MVNGQHFSGTGYQLDGTENRDPILGIIVINPTLESIGETKITSQNYDAEFGQATAGVVSVQTKSGTNHLHGSAFEFYQNDKFQARNPFTQFQADRADRQVHPRDQAQPVRRLDRRPDQDEPVVLLRRLPGHARHAGRLAAADRADRGGAPRRPERVRREHLRSGAPAQPVPRSSRRPIPSGRLSPQAQAILELIPLPNAAGRDNGTRDNYIACGSETFTENSFNVRVDGRLSDNLNTFGRYSLGDFLRDGPTAFGDGGGPELVSLGGVSDVRNQSVAYRHRSRVLDVAAGRLPLRLLPVQGQRAAVRLRHHAGRGRGHSRPQPGHDVHVGPARRVHRRGPRLQLRLGPRREPLQLPARSGREADAVGRQRDQAARGTTASSSASTCGAPTTCACRATAPVGRTDLHGNRTRGPAAAGWASRRSCSATSRASAATSARAPMRASASGGISTTRRTPGGRPPS